MLGHVRTHAVCGSGLRVIIGAMREFELCRRMPQEAHLDAVRNTAGVGPNPRLVLVESDSDLARVLSGLGGGGFAFVKVPSVAGIWRTADWHEREVYDLSGIWFTDHPNMVRILLAEDWQGHPLRKDYEYPLEYHGIRGR